MSPESTPEDRQPDYEALLRSPYDPDEPADRPEGESDLPWIPAVIAACAGALAVGAFVVFAVATGPDTAEEAEQPPASSSTTLAAVVSDGPPPGFTAVTDQVSAAPVAVDVSASGTVVTVATAVAGGVDPATVEPLDVAYWTLTSGGSDTTMVRQFTEKVGVGNTTVVFPPVVALRQAAVTPYLAIGQPLVDTTTIELEAEYGQSLDPFVVTVGDVSIAVDELSFAESWGWISWTSSGGVAQVDPTITFVGTDDPSADGENPTLLVPPSRRPFTFGTPTQPLPTPYAFSGSEGLVRVGEPIAGDNQASSIRIDLVITVPGDVTASVPIALPPSP